MVETADAHFCTCGIPTLKSRTQDVTPTCLNQDDAEDCIYDCCEIECEPQTGPFCLVGNVSGILNRCLIYEGCQPVQTINLCSNPEEEKEYWVTVAFDQAQVHDMRACSFTNCFHGTCDGIYFPECSTDEERCPDLP